MTALTFRLTLSRVMTSCGGTSRVTTRRSTFTMRSIPGTIQLSPARFVSAQRLRRAAGELPHQRGADQAERRADGENDAPPEAEVRIGPEATPGVPDEQQRPDHDA